MLVESGLFIFLCGHMTGSVLAMYLSWISGQISIEDAPSLADETAEKDAQLKSPQRTEYRADFEHCSMAVKVGE
ncbi:hypothetical protein MKEN_00476700 [Mycena kentingensis (nom. inval.)]|nr:hypothetical protein MKEN_00476700 [Mycena kentingensis (nom. inval.)]